MAVVTGEADIYVHDGGMYQWDSAAPAAVALAAGLHVSRIDGSPMVFNDRDPWLPDLLICRTEFAEPGTPSAARRSYNSSMTLAVPGDGGRLVEPQLTLDRAATTAAATGPTPGPTPRSTTRVPGSDHRGDDVDRRRRHPRRGSRRARRAPATGSPLHPLRGRPGRCRPAGVGPPDPLARAADRGRQRRRRRRWLATRITGISWIDGLEVREAPQFADTACALLGRRRRRLRAWPQRWSASATSPRHTSCSRHWPSPR